MSLPTPEKKIQAAHERRERWVRVGTKRTAAVLHAVATLERCANRASYGFEEHEVERAFHAIDSALLRAREAFRPKQEPLCFTADDLLGGAAQEA